MKQFIFTLCILVVILSWPLSPAETVQKNGPSWYQDAVVYEAFTRSFYDTDQDGIGDIKGLIAKLDYLNDGKPETTTDLGVNAI
jgi:alpha-amylase